jgi:hypothetical protein
VFCARFLLGFVEASFFPGALVCQPPSLSTKINQFVQLLLSRWYKRNELSQRTAVLYCGSLISNAFGSLFASAVLDIMNGVRGYAAWR